MPTVAFILTQIAGMVFASLLTFAATAYWTTRSAHVRKAERIEQEHTALIARIIELERQHSLLGQAILPISTAFQQILIKELTHMHTPILDALLQKIGPPCTLSPEEELELFRGLKERTLDLGDLITDSERDAALILPYVMKRAHREASLSATQRHFELVLVEGTIAK